jgi:hypothetical protein
MVWRVATAVAVSAIVSMTGCQSGVLDKASATSAIDGGRVGIAEGGAIGSGGSADTSTPRLLSCDAAQPDATDWTEVVSPPSLEGLVIKEGWAAGRDDVFFVGTLAVPGNDVQSVAQIVRWTRGCWSLELSSSMASQLSVSISGSSPGDVWAVLGDALFRGDGTGWSRADDEMQEVLTAQHPGSTAVPYAVRVAAGTIWVMGKTFIWRRDASGWRMFELTNSDVFGADDSGARGTFSFTSMWAGGHDDAVVGGAIHEVGRIPDAAFVYRYDGSGWTRQIFTDGRVASLWGDGGGGLWIGAPNGSVNPPLFHAEPASSGVAGFRTVSIDGWPAGISVNALWGAAPDDLLAASGGSLAHWDGVEWKMAAAPATTAADDVAVIAGAAASTAQLTTSQSTWIVRRGPRFFRQDR